MCLSPESEAALRRVESFLLDLVGKREMCPYCGGVRTVRLGRRGPLQHVGGCRYERALDDLRAAQLDPRVV